VVSCHFDRHATSGLCFVAHFNLLIQKLLCSLDCSLLQQVSVQLQLIYALSQIRISLPPDIRPLKARQDILLDVQKICDRFPQGLPKINPGKVKFSTLSYHQLWYVQLLVSN
jgi:hypothetical protein